MDSHLKKLLIKVCIYWKSMHSDVIQRTIWGVIGIDVALSEVLFTGTQIRLTIDILHFAQIWCSLKSSRLGFSIRLYFRIW